MTAFVKVLPSGHEFILEGRSTLLEAGLRAGLALEYGCSNGNCGKCLARLVSGDVQKARHHDFRISEQQKINGHMLLCCNTTDSDVVIEAREASSAHEITQQHLTARVRDIRIVSDDVALLHLKTPRTQRLRFMAGQHVMLGGNDLPQAHYSVASCPCDDMNLHFQVPRSEQDAFSEIVFGDLKKGEKVDVTGPGGEFVLDEESPRSPVFIAWQTGFAPIRSLIEHAMSLEVVESISLVWIARNKDHRYLDNLCRSWNDALDDFSYVPVDADVRQDYLDIINVLTRQLGIGPDDLPDHDFFIAGNSGLLDHCQKALSANGLPVEQLFTDSLIHA
jgi:CDP-4-dehydro-6-deoxyglucose reductase